MQTEQAIAVAIFALQDPSILAAPPKLDVAFDLQPRSPYVENAKHGIFLRGRRLSFSAVGRTANADSDHLKAYSKECEKYAKIMPGYPQPAFVTFSVTISL